MDCNKEKSQLIFPQNSFVAFEVNVVHSHSMSYKAHERTWLGCRSTCQKAWRAGGSREDEMLTQGTLFHLAS